MATKKKPAAKKKPAKKPVAKSPSTRPKTASLRANGGKATKANGGKATKAKTTKPKPKATGIKPVEKPPSAPASSDFLALVEVFTERPGVTRARMMGCEGLRVGAKYFAMEWRGELVVKLPRESVESYTAAGHGRPFDPGMGRPMKEWLTVPPGHADWRNLAEQAFDFVAASL
jgi:hypothetical protein